MSALIMIAVNILSKHRQQQSVHRQDFHIHTSESQPKPSIGSLGKRQIPYHKQSKPLLLRVILVFEPCGVFPPSPDRRRVFFWGGLVASPVGHALRPSFGKKMPKKNQGRQHWLLKGTTGGSVSCILQICSI